MLWEGFFCQSVKRMRSDAAKIALRASQAYCATTLLDKRTCLAAFLVATTCFGLPPVQCASRNHPSKTQIEQRLDYVVGLRSFSPARPLSQNRLMNLVLDLADWGDFPERYQPARPARLMKGCDSYITRPMARRFISDLVGQDLRVWRPEKDNFKPRMEGDKLGWWFNTGNSMYERPHVHLIGQPSIKGKRVSCRFQLFHRMGNLVDSPPNKIVGSGTAALDRVGDDWVVRSWQVRRQSEWIYKQVE